MDIYEFAMKMEMDGKQYYMELKDKAKNKGLEMIFRTLAKDEQSHYDRILSLKNNVVLEQQSLIFDDARNIFEMMFKSKKEVMILLSEDALRHALKLEEESIKFYEEQAGKTESKTEKEVLSLLAREEKKHYLVIETLLDHISGGIMKSIESAEFQNWE